jgi:hypothetical protein
MHQAMPRTLRNVSFALVVGLCGAMPAAAATVPFNGTLTISETVIPAQYVPQVPANCDFVGIISGTGVIAPLGPVTMSSTDCIEDQMDGTFKFTPLGPVQFTTANGDKVFATYEGTFSLLPGNALVGTYTIVGGTGRFANAGGGGALQGFEILDGAGHGTGQIQLNGKVSF